MKLTLHIILLHLALSQFCGNFISILVTPAAVESRHYRSSKHQSLHVPTILQAQTSQRKEKGSRTFPTKNGSTIQHKFQKRVPTTLINSWFKYKFNKSPKKSNHPQKMNLDLFLLKDGKTNELPEGPRLFVSACWLWALAALQAEIRWAFRWNHVLSHGKKLVNIG